MNKTSLLNSSKILLICFLITFLASCSSYRLHWVKVKSADPTRIKKEDFYNNQPDLPGENNFNLAKSELGNPRQEKDYLNKDYQKNEIQSIPEQLTLDQQSREAILSYDAENIDSKYSLANQTKPVLNPEFKKDHGFTSLPNNLREEKARAIFKTLSPERLAALKSKDLAIRTQALKQTIHEQMLKNPSSAFLYSKLSTRKQEKLENKLSAKMASPYRERGLEDLNSYFLIGLLLLIPTILFALIPGLGALGVLFGVISVIFIILGLVQMVG